MSQSKNNEDKLISDEMMDNLLSVLHNLDYPMDDLEEKVCLPLAQWLQTTGYSIENTNYVISSVVNINHIQKEIDEIYDPDFPPIYTQSDLMNFLSEKEYNDLEKIINPPKHQSHCNISIREDTTVQVDFNTCKINLVKPVYKGTELVDYKYTPVIEAVPHKLTVYDSEFVDLSRVFKITWKSTHSKRLFTTAGEGTGATIKDIEKSLVAAGYSHNQRLMGDVLSAAINGMIDDGLAEVKDTIDNKGVYYNPSTNKVLVVKLNYKQPSYQEICEAIDVLEELNNAYFKESVTFATVMKWSLVSVFSYAMKQGGKYMPWLYLVGAGGSGKTTLAKIGTYFYGEPSTRNILGGGSFNTEYRIGDKISQDCTYRNVNEPAATFKREETIETVKNSVELKVCREVQGKTYPAFSPVIFTANIFIPEHDSLYRRLFIIEFEYNQRKSGRAKKDFENKFNIDFPEHSILKRLRVFGRIAIREVISNPSLLFDDWKDLADNLFECAYNMVDLEVPSWLKEWSKDKDLSDLDNTQIENIRNILVDELYNARKRITLRGDYGQVEEFSLDGDEVSSNSKQFESLYWDLVNERVFNWAVPHKPRGKPKSIFLNQGFKKLINSHLEDSGTLKSIGQLLHWEHKPVRFGKSKQYGLLVPFEEFMSFVYPSVDDDEFE